MPLGPFKFEPCIDCGGSATCCCNYVAVFILCGTPVNFTFDHTRDNSASGTGGHGICHGSSTITDPGTLGEGLSCPCRVIVPSGYPTLLAQLQVEFTSGCVFESFTGNLDLATTSGGTTPSRYAGDALCHINLEIFATDGTSDLTGVTCRIYKVCNCTYAYMGSATFPDGLGGSPAYALGPVNNCCCKCCPFPGSGPAPGAGFFRHWLIAITGTLGGGAPGCCTSLPSSETVIITSTATPSIPSEGSLGDRSFCVWNGGTWSMQSDGGVISLFPTAAFPNCIFSGNDLLTCRIDESDNSPITFSIEDCTGLTATATPVAGTWQSCYAPLPSMLLGEERKADRPPCAFFGKPTGDTVDCPTCAGRVSLKLFACSVFGKCTPAKAAQGVACCVGCKEYEAA